MPRTTTTRSQASAAAGAAASSMEAGMPVLSATAEPADLSQPAAAVASCATFGEQQDGGEQSRAAQDQEIERIMFVDQTVDNDDPK